MEKTGGRRSDRRGGPPGIGGRIVAASRDQAIRSALRPREVVAAPDDHLLAAPDRGGGLASPWRTERRGGAPGIGGRVVAASRIEQARSVAPAPNDHLPTAPYGIEIDSSRGCPDHRDRAPGIADRIVAAPGSARPPSPDDHLLPGPD